MSLCKVRDRFMWEVYVRSVTRILQENWFCDKKVAFGSACGALKGRMRKNKFQKVVSDRNLKLFSRRRREKNLECLFCLCRQNQDFGVYVGNCLCKQMKSRMQHCP